MHPLVLSLALLGLSMCAAEPDGFGPADRVWQLTSLDGTAFTARATLSFPEDGQIAGEAPCNRYSGVMTTPYPWFDAGQVVSTRRACPELAAEQQFLSALSTMHSAERDGDVLILRAPAGREMRFTAGD
ncbi:META domain-containing protein [Pseudodonghicola flavimaris]|uniref:META domain-containing protein n=1 Tax=Pseudodonghicola flavimaris TaxID=3050036 RepID=A0ABT7F6J1_9RHOB|nr:META domain-containing protein [Pseudodonghicola flavimaris]MDK3020222.1 META domain-containing protein [Pseudodonghicola flavimaris]